LRKSPLSSTHLSLHDQLILGTKDHLKTIRPEWRSQLHARLSEVEFDERYV